MAASRWSSGCAAQFGTEIPNSVPEVVRAMPFAPFHNTLGPKGERWLPCHAKLAHDRAVPFHHALEALLAEESRDDGAPRHRLRRHVHGSGLHRLRL